MPDMSFWLDLSAPPKAPAGVDPFRDEMPGDSGEVLAGVDPNLYRRLQAALNEVLDGVIWPSTRSWPT
jgi:hypothetical protein